ncbi:MAG TPA: aromatic ring-hydroxylating dioxygenase subunit alpha [Stellaceae bacterium]|jgi:phenylpropionate dioxygenase-like ring-hydroxylating dioxygenase large terminal subunit
MDTLTPHHRNSVESLFVEDEAAGIFRFSPKVYSDPELFDSEQQRIFGHCWLYAAHESEVPNAGDFLTRRVGGRPLLIVRGADGKVRLFHNSCRHRGTMVCRERSGTAKNFTCFYHYWTYDNAGRLIGVPEKESYGPGFAQSEMGLYEVRAEAYRGWLFACFSRETVPLVDYLAEARDYLDMILDQDEDGSVILPGAHEYSMRANWKMLMENTVDIYHLNSTHSRFMHDYLPRVLGLATPDPRTMNNGAMSPKGLGNGHAVIEYRKFSGVADAAKRKAWQAKFGAARADRMLDYTRTLVLFPNTLFIEQRRVIRTCFPLAPDHAEVTGYPLMPAVDDPAVRKQRLDIYLSFLGPAGFATPDDNEVMELIQKNCATLPEGAMIECSRGMGSSAPRPDDEAQMRAFWRRWRELIGESAA